MGHKIKIMSRQVWFVAFAISAATVGGERLFAHDPSTEPNQAQLAAFAADGTLADRERRAVALKMHEADLGMQQQARLRIERARLQAAGLDPAEVARRLTRGPHRAFPFTQQPELKSTGQVKTLTILVEFNDHTHHPSLTPATIWPNIYGKGTQIAQAFRPYESVSAYYSRASQGKVELLGSVLGWTQLPKNRSEYEPDYTGLVTDFQKNKADNQALFEIISTAMNSLDATHDFSEYDNDGDGDIDLVTVLYAGPPQGWSSFWWAYRWQFHSVFTPQALTTKFDGKILNQFVFQYTNTRPMTQDYNPLTLLHEMGHAFGLPDYYDYKSGVGPDGGVGDLDMMDANWGNHNAFSRWCLDWIEPKVLGSGAPAIHSLNASGSTGLTDKAIAIFPNLQDTVAPAGELFVLESRQQLGNDGDLANTPANGILIWHVDAAPNSASSGFQLNNSYSTPKLIRLVRADNDQDFSANGRANADTYFEKDDTFGPNTVPASNAYDGDPTGVSVKVVSEVDIEQVQVKVGFVATGPTPVAPAAPAPAVPAPAALAGDDAEGVEAASQDEGYEEVDLDFLITYANSLSKKTTQQMEAEWQKRLQALREENSPQNRLMAETLLTQWAFKDGVVAVKAALQIPENLNLSESAYRYATEAWANTQPELAGAWYFSSLRNIESGDDRPKPTAAFLRAIVRNRGLESPEEALETLDVLATPEEVYGAAEALQSLNVPIEKYRDKLLKKLDEFNEQEAAQFGILREAHDPLQ